MVLQRMIGLCWAVLQSDSSFLPSADCNFVNSEVNCINSEFVLFHEEY